MSWSLNLLYQCPKFICAEMKNIENDADNTKEKKKHDASQLAARGVGSVGNKLLLLASGALNYCWRREVQLWAAVYLDVQENQERQVVAEYATAAHVLAWRDALNSPCL